MDCWILNADGEPERAESLDAWGRWCRTADRTLARTDLPFGAFVSTVFLGMDHAWDGGPPVLWETMVFPDCEVCERYTSREDALRGHARVVEEQTPYWAKRESQEAP